MINLSENNRVHVHVVPTLARKRPTRELVCSKPLRGVHCQCRDSELSGNMCFVGRIIPANT